MTKIPKIFICCSTILAVDLSLGEEVASASGQPLRTASEKRTAYLMNGNREDEYFGYTPLINAVKVGDTEKVRELIEAGADVNWRTDYGFTPLMFACDRGHVAVAKLLLEKGSDRHVASKEGSTALMLAEKNRNVELVEVLKKD